MRGEGNLFEYFEEISTKTAMKKMFVVEFVFFACVETAEMNGFFFRRDVGESEPDRGGLRIASSTQLEVGNIARRWALIFLPGV